MSLTSPLLPDAPAWQREVEAVENAARLAFLAQDTERLGQLWAEDLVVNSPIQRVLDREQVLDLLARGVIRHASHEVTIETLRRHGDVVVVMGHDVVTEAEGAPPVRRRFTDVWRETASGWRMIARHANAVVPA